MCARVARIRCVASGHFFGFVRFFSQKIDCIINGNVNPWEKLVDPKKSSNQSSADLSVEKFNRNRLENMNFNHSTPSIMSEVF